MLHTRVCLQKWNGNGVTISGLSDPLEAGMGISWGYVHSSL